MTARLARAQVERLVLAASSAGSADNSQPWAFRWDGVELAILHDRERARHALDHRFCFSYLTLGGVLEALRIGAAREGLSADIALRIPAETGEVWATLRFEEGDVERSPLDDALALRATDRRIYRGGSLSDPVFAAAAQEAARFPGCGVRFLARCPPDLGEYLEQGDSFVWRHEHVYRDLLRWVRFTRKEAEATRDGATMRGLGYDFPELPGLGAARSPLVQRLLEQSRFYLVPRLLLRRQLASSAALFCVTARGDGPRDLVDVGRTAFLIWLHLNRAGYGVQPISLQSIFARAYLAGEPPPGTKPEFAALFRCGPAILARAFGCEPGELPLWLFRTGLSPAPTAELRTLRRSVDRILTFA